MDVVNTTLCRICLEEGASYPIFDEENGEGNSIFSKLSKCVKEKIEDIEGFPRNICSFCKDTLNTVCNFISKYKESSKILHSGLLAVKENCFSDNDNNYSEIEVEIKDIKTEPVDFEEIEDNECLAELIKPLTKLKPKIKKEIKKISRNKEITIKRIKIETKNNTNKIASSLLEGEFNWTGEKWCLKSRKCISSKVIEKKVRKETKERIRREPKLIIPKIKKPDPPKLCEQCGQVFKSQDKLSAHKKNVHSKNPVKCSECPRIFASDYHLNRHMRRRHNPNKNFICSLCGKGFAFKGELTTHNRNVHDKHLRPKKVFACKFCDKTYKCAKSVLVHERSVHTGHRPAECDICGSRFYHIDYLKEHMRLHTGETPFKCPICGRGYAQRGNMKSHLRIHRLAEIDSETMSKIRPNYLRLLKDFR